MQIDHKSAALRYQNKVNNAQGHFFEQAIKAACALYDRLNRSACWRRAATGFSKDGSRPAHSQIFKGHFRAGAPLSLKQSTPQQNV